MTIIARATLATATFSAPQKPDTVNCQIRMTAAGGDTEETKNMPSGTLEMTITDPSTVEFLKAGEEYILEIKSAVAT